MDERDSSPSQFEQALTARLSRLRSMPVDTSRMDVRLQAEIPRPVAQHSRLRLLHPLRAIAAVLVVALVVAAALWMSSGGPVLASAATMAELHRDMVENRVPVMSAGSVEEAGRLLPQVPAEHTMVCCMREIKNKKVACILLRNHQSPVTISVADAADMRLPSAPSIMRDGTRYYIQSFEKLNMVMSEREGRWICIIGQLPSERLIDVSSRLKFSAAAEPSKAEK